MYLIPGWYHYISIKGISENINEVFLSDNFFLTGTRSEILVHIYRADVDELIQLHDSVKGETEAQKGELV